MNPWEVLGIPPTADLQAIKQAYAEQSKRFHPEEHPEAFQRLHTAYRSAAAQARKRKPPAAPEAPAAPAAPEASEASAAPESPASSKPKPAGGKPWFYAPPARNAARPNRYRSQDDDLPYRPKPRQGPLPPEWREPSLHTLFATKRPATLPARGAQRGTDPAGTLDFSSLDQPDAGEEPPAAPPDAAPCPDAAPSDAGAQPAPPRGRDPSRGYQSSMRLSALMLLVCSIYLLLPLPVLCAAAVVLFVLQRCFDTARRSWRTTFLEGAAEALLCLVIYWRVQQTAPGALDAFPQLGLCLGVIGAVLPVYHLARRVVTVGRGG